MSWQICENKNKAGPSNNSEMVEHHDLDHHHNTSIFIMRLFHFLAISALTLTFPLSFALISRLSTASYHLSILTLEPPPKSLISSIFISSNPSPLHILLACVSLHTLVNGLAGRPGPPSQPVFRPRLVVAWIVLCALEGCVALGVEASFTDGVNGKLGSGEGRSMLSKVVFFLGLHETMAHWARTIVRPTMDDTIFGGPQEERRAERWALTAGFGVVWWWRLRDEVDSLVGVMVGKKDMKMEIGLGDFVGWWLYYVTVVIGIIRIFRGIVCVIMVTFNGRQEDDGDYCSVGFKDGGDRV